MKDRQRISVFVDALFIWDASHASHASIEYFVCHKHKSEKNAKQTKSLRAKYVSNRKLQFHFVDANVASQYHILARCHTPAIRKIY